MRGSNESQREEVIPFYLARGHSGPESHGRILGQRGAERLSSYRRHLEEETIAAVSFSITPEDEVRDAAVQNDWITQNETEAICEHVSCGVPGRGPFLDDRVLIPFGVWSSLKDELIVFRQRCK